METVKIVFDIDSKDVKTTTEELKALNKVTNDEVKALDNLSTAATDAGDGFVSLRSQVRQAKEEAQKAADKYGEFSKEANIARQRAGALADQMGDLNRQVNLLNPEAKAKAFSNLATGVVGAFSIATGAVQAFGIKNKEVEEIAMKLQAALNITQGIASLGALKEAYQDVKVVLGFTVVAQEAMVVATEAEAVASTQAAVATRGFTAALLTNPIFLAVAAIAALAGAMLLLNKDTEEAEKEVVKMTESQKELRAASNEAAAAADDLAVAQGKLSKEAAAGNNARRENAASIEDLNEKLRLNNAEIEKNNKVIRKGNEALKEAEEANASRKRSEQDTIIISQVAGQAYLDAAKKNKELAAANKDITATIKAKNEATKISIETLNEEKKTADTEKQIADSKKLAAERKQAAKEEEAAAKERLRLADALRKKLQENALAEETDPTKRIALARQFANQNYALELERLQNTEATQDQIDLLAVEHTDLIKKLSNEEVKINQDKNAKVLEAEKRLQKALLDLALAEETDPLKRAQIINDAKEIEIDNQLALVEKGSKEEQALLADKARFEIEAQQRVGAAQVETNKNTTGQILKTEEELKEERIKKAKFAVDAIATLNQSLLDFQTQRFAQESAETQALYDKKLITEKQYQERLRAIKRKEWEANRRAALATAAIGVAQGVVNALTIQPASLIPFAIALAATVGAVQIAAIASQKPPQFAKGTLSVPGIDMGRDSVHAILQPGEAVIPTKTNRAYHPTIKAIYEKKISPSEINNFVMSRTSSGGRQSVTANIDTYALGRALGKNKTVEVGNANMIGKAMAKELLRGQNVRRL
jgi:hypothetical protein